MLQKAQNELSASYLLTILIMILITVCVSSVEESLFTSSDNPNAAAHLNERERLVAVVLRAAELNAHVYDLLLELRARVTRGGGGSVRGGSSRSARAEKGRARAVREARAARLRARARAAPERDGARSDVTRPHRVPAHEQSFQDAVKHPSRLGHNHRANCARTFIFREVKYSVYACHFRARNETRFSALKRERQLFSRLFKHSDKVL